MTLCHLDWTRQWRAAALAPPEEAHSLAEESDDELTWILTSGGEVRGSVTAGRLPTGWVIQYYSRPA